MLNSGLFNLARDCALWVKKLINFFGSADSALNLAEIEQTGEFILHERAYSYISEIDIQDKYHIKVLFEEADDKLKEALNKSLKFFEDLNIKNLTQQR